MSNTDKKPWHREPMVWMVIVIPASAIVAGAVMLWLAIETYDGLVVDDYYKEGKEINRRFERDRRADELGFRGQIILDPANNRVQMNLASGEGIDLPSEVDASFLHTTRAGYDEKIILRHQGSGVFLGQFDAPLERGSWKVQIGNKDWRIIGRLTIPSAPHTGLAPVGTP